MIHHIEEERINDEIIKNNEKISIIDFFADWCEPCKMLTPILNELDKKYKEVEIYKINIDEAKNSAITFNINAIPTMIFFKDGEEVDRKVGVETLENLSKIIEELN